MFRAAPEGHEGAGEVGAPSGGPAGSGRGGPPARSMSHLNGQFFFRTKPQGLHRELVYGFGSAVFGI